MMPLCVSPSVHAHEKFFCFRCVFVVTVCLHLFFHTVFASTAAADSNAGLTVTQAITDVCRWGFRGAGYHMHLAVEFPLNYDEVCVFLELPRAFFFDAAEVEQLYSITALGEDVTREYTPLGINSTFFFDIEAPAFLVGYKVNSVRVTFRRLSSREGATTKRNPTAKGLLLLPIHARYEEVDTATPFSLQAFFGRESFVRRCIPALSVQDWKTAARCHTLPAPMGQESRSPSDNTTVGSSTPSNCLDIPVALLSSAPLVYIALVALQCVGVVIVVLSLLRV
ncbi:hypothetical protein TcYC6_0045510 [Trypanosoma cruzi]|nr:hypothetical protein TcYC6_0045510 [Trypanosoma cruzi]